MIDKLRKELRNEIYVMADQLRKAACAKVKTLTLEDLQADGYCGFDYLHDAVHTLRGQLPKGGADLKEMRDLWVEKV